MGKVSMVCFDILFKISLQVLFLEREFKDGEDLLLYSFAPYPHARIQSFLDDKVTLQKIAENGRKKVMEKHTWLARAEKIVETVMYHKHFMA
ncbi:hypothetical protein DI43_17265 [Geobacillus sp. CAMR12739]|nr:hypothetical protein DI43_17265 [Geobacillus sp. CAMR12739]